jgi:hypothetical protein
MLCLFDSTPSIPTNSIYTDQQPPGTKMVKLPIFALALAMTSGLASAADFHSRFC